MPLTWRTGTLHGGFMLFDGVGSWGSGAEAAAWTRERLAQVFAKDPPPSAQVLSETLMVSLANLPASIAQDEFGWSFSVGVALIAGDTLQVASLGRHAIVALQGGRATTLAGPARLVDELVESGRISMEEAEQHPLSRILKGPFQGDSGGSLVWSEPMSLTGLHAVVAGDAALPRLLTLGRVELCADPVRLRDAVEKGGGRSTSTGTIWIG